MIKLHQFKPLWGIPNPSPFCVKVEAFMRMAKIPYETVVSPDPRRAPKGKLPFIEDDGARIGDSTHILDYLRKKHGDPLGDGSLPPRSRAEAHAIKALFEDRMYFAGLYSRWVDDEGWPRTREMLSGMPPIISTIVPPLIRKGIRRRLLEQGLGRHSREEIYAFAVEDVGAASELLGDKPFFMGESAKSIDATAFGFLVQLISTPFTQPHCEAARARPNLVRYVDRIKTQFFS